MGLWFITLWPLYEHNLTRRQAVYQAALQRSYAGQTGLITAALALLLAGCDPSPASVALRQGPVAPAPLPSPEELAPEQAPEPMESLNTEAVLVAPALVDSQPADVDVPEKAPDGSLVLLGKTVPPGEAARLTWSASEVFEGITTATPVLVVNGKREGPVLCLTAAIHGDELNGIEMVRRILHELEPEELSGAVIGVPIVNLQGFRRGSRYLPDRRDLNRYFPGNPEGSSAARIAYSLFEEIIRRCDVLVDLHTGSFYRTNLPQLRADLRYRRVREMTEGFGGMVVLHNEGAPGTLRRAATDAGIPAVTLEAGEPLRLQSSKVSEGVDGVFALLSATDMIRRVQLLRQPEPVFYESTWVRADYGGILFSVVRLGQLVDSGDVLGTVTDPITNDQNLIYASNRGRVLGMALNQVVMPGFAAFRIGIETDGQPDPMVATAEWGQTEMGEERVLEEEAENDDVGPAEDPDLEESS
jgi:predicted deacylase